VLCGGESVRAQRELIPLLGDRIIAVKHGVLLAPHADVLFFAGERPAEIAPPLLAAYKGRPIGLMPSTPLETAGPPMGRVIVRGRGHPVFPSWTKRVGRTTTHEAFAADQTLVAGFDAGTSAINVAIHYGATEIVLVGYDMIGGRWFTGEVPHYLPQPPESDFERHLGPLPSLAADARCKGITIWNASPISRATCFPYRPLEDFV
jgi:hypothetical protein